jgi:hypothetical protein
MNNREQIHSGTLVEVQIRNCEYAKVLLPEPSIDRKKVFKVMWSEPMGQSRLSSQNKDPVGTGTPISEYGQRKIGDTLLYEGIRRFIVIDGTENDAHNGNSICV